MPISRYSDKSPIFFEPDESIELARYLDLTKFLSLLKDKQVFFCRLDKLEDRFEGTMPQMSKQYMVDWHKYMRDVRKFYTVPMTDNDIDESVNTNLEFREKLKTINCINCWNHFNSESYALWKLYSDLNKGIMIKTSFKSLIKAFEKSEEKIYCSTIKYIDFERDRIDISNTMSLMVHKHKAYSYEEEVRLIHQVSNVGWKHDWNKEKYENGVKISVDLNELIDEIIISPFSPDWFTELIEDLLDKYSLNCNLINSKLK